jgi:hypothetical protein
MARPPPWHLRAGSRNLGETSGRKPIVRSPTVCKESIPGDVSTEYATRHPMVSAPGSAET